ncbi:hypothetical protein [Bradyrhizobium stylosanthis]|uniref:hypothetical protein n=1 Tax=Bradyrhizobium stylosanthis TaxID=1803665 RepID=UPI0011A35E6F
MAGDSNRLPSEGILIDHEHLIDHKHDIAQSRVAKRPRTLINPPPRNVALITPESAVIPSAVSDPSEVKWTPDFGPAA